MSTVDELTVNPAKFGKLAACRACSVSLNGRCGTVCGGGVEGARKRASLPDFAFTA